MKDAGIKIDFVECDDEMVIFENGVELPIIAYWDPERDHETDDPVEGGWIEFGNEEVGFGWYPIKLISEDEWLQERRARTRAAVEAGAAEARRH